MRIPPYWICERRVVRGKYVRKYYISDVSLEDARLSRTPAAQLVESADSYHTPIYEPVLAVSDDCNVVTRNHYGCRVLNTTSVCFADVDTVPNTVGNRIRAIFGKGLTPEERLLATIRSLTGQDSTLGVRVYRTVHGWRLVLAGQGISLQSPRMQQLFRLLNVDACYARLCRLQRCWRARISPKPFFRGLKRFPFPLHSDWESDSAAVAWVQNYETATAGLAVCRLIAEIGAPINDPIVNWHDEATSAMNHNLKLG